MTKQSDRVGLIGVGETADPRASALRASGLEITAVSTRPGSERLHDFATRHKITKVFDDWRDMLQEPDRWDGLAIATWPDGTPDVLQAALELDVPILVEKPVAWNSARLRELCARPHDNVIVGYNRRFYRSVQAARTEVQQGPPMIAQLTMPASVTAPEEYDPSGYYLYILYESVPILGIDLTRFIFGDLQLQAVQRLKNPAGNLVGLAAILTSSRGDIVQLNGNWESASNFMLTLNRPGRRFELLPFEIASVYEGLEVLQATEEHPIRQYIPKKIESIVLDGNDLTEKPGYVGETMALRDMMKGEKPPTFTARLEDALAATSLCEKLTGVTLSDTNPNLWDWRGHDTSLWQD